MSTLLCPFTKKACHWENGDGMCGEHLEKDPVFRGDAEEYAINKLAERAGEAGGEGFSGKTSIEEVIFTRVGHEEKAYLKQSRLIFR